MSNVEATSKRKVERNVTTWIWEARTHTPKSHWLTLVSFRVLVFNSVFLLPNNSSIRQRHFFSPKPQPSEPQDVPTIRTAKPHRRHAVRIRNARFHYHVEIDLGSPTPSENIFNRCIPNGKWVLYTFRDQKRIICEAGVWTTTINFWQTYNITIKTIQVISMKRHYLSIYTYTQMRVCSEIKTEKIGLIER